MRLANLLSVLSGGDFEKPQDSDICESRVVLRVLKQHE